MPINITMPALSPTMTEGNLAKWHKAVGDKVEAGDVIAEIETDKATMEVEAVDEGVLGKIIVAEGTENVPVNEVIAVLLEEGESASDAVAQQPAKAPASSKSEAPKVMPTPQKPTPTPQAPSGNRVFVSPLARRLAAEKGIDLSAVKGSGPHGRIVKADVESAPTGTTAPTSSPTTVPAIDTKSMVDALGIKYTEIPNNNIKKITAQRLVESKQTVPHFYLTIDCEIDNLLQTRKEVNDKAAGKYKLSVNDFIIKACAMALKSYPAANVSWSNKAILQYEQADISVAVSTPNGLITPIVRGADDKGMREISDEVKDLAGRAREGKLKPEEFQGGTFTVSNLGMFGIKEFAAIINPPQACILAVGAGREQPVAYNGEIKIKTVMSCTLSTDHRAVDGAVGAEFLQILKEYIENPVNMLV
ncbi:MAG: acetyltransferase component of pyruvate dehydrogenase complex [Micavibrio sp.]|nr:MAG: acetyltransferase component of pyruvate dehydrogenase complex [Micavibrio sp.]